MVYVLPCMPFTGCLCQWLQIKHYASQLRCTSGFCGRAHLVFYLSDWSGTHFATTQINYHIYADDIQLYVSFKPNQADALHALSQLENAMNDVHSWLNSHSLKLNSAKSEFLLFGSKTQLSKINLFFWYDN